MTHKFIEDIANGVRENMDEAIREDSDYACYNYDTDCGVIEVYVNEANDCEVVVSHDDDRKREHTNIVSAVMNAIPDWHNVVSDVMDSVSDMWNDHGFRDARAYEVYKFGRGGLR